MKFLSYLKEASQYSDSPHTIFQTADELIAHCCENTDEVHSIYWRSESVPQHAEVFFLADGNVIFGMSASSEDHQSVDAISYDLCRYLNSSDVFVTYEDVPPENAIDFRAILDSLTTDPSESDRQNRTHKPIRVEPN